MADVVSTIGRTRVNLGRAMLLILLVALVVVVMVRWVPPRVDLSDITLPDGFVIEMYSNDVPNARSLALGDEGTVFVGTRRRGHVYALVDTDGDQKADKVYTIARGLTMPNGVAFRDGDLYVAEVNRILRYDDIEGRLRNPPEPVVVNETLPAEQHHGWRFIRFGPDGLLYVPIGAPCNVCMESDERFATIARMRPDAAVSRSMRAACATRSGSTAPRNKGTVVHR